MEEVERHKQTEAEDERMRDGGWTRRNQEG